MPKELRAWPDFVYIFMWADNSQCRKNVYFPTKDGKMPINLRRQIRWMSKYQSSYHFKVVKYFLPDKWHPQLFPTNEIDT